MTQQTSPFLEGKYGWGLGESGWNFGMDENLLKFSYLFDRNIDGIVSSLPAPVNGQAYFLTTDNRIYFAANSLFSSTPTPKWFEVTLRSSGQTYQFNGTSLVAVQSTSSFATDLANNINPALGSSLSGFDGGTITNVLEYAKPIASYSVLRTYSGVAKAVFITDPTTHGVFLLDPADTTSADDGATIIKQTSGTKRWKRLYSGPRQAAWYGVSPLIANNSTALQSAVSKGGQVLFADGVYTYNTGMVVDYQGAGFPAVTIPSPRVDIMGCSMGNTIFEYAGTGIGLSMQGMVGVTATQGISSADKTGNFTIYRQTRDVQGTGIKVTNKAHFRLENITSSYFLDGMVIEGALTGDLSNIILENNKAGLEISQSTYTLPNALNFSGVRFKANQFFGMKGTIGGGNVFTGGTCEGNGRQGVGSDGGMLLSLNGSNGSACLHIDSYYFENNAGAADLYLDNISPDHVTVTLTNCIFTRIDPLHYVTANIQCVNSGGGGITVIMNGCTFESKGSYIPSAARPFMIAAAGCNFINNGCEFSETTSLGTSGANSPTFGMTTSGRVNSAGSSVFSPPGIVVASTGTGTYTVTKADGWGSNINSYVASAVLNAGAGAGRGVSVVQNSTTVFTVNTYTASTGAAINTDFSWTCTTLC